VLPLERLPARPDVRQWLNYYIEDFGGEPVEAPELPETSPPVPDGFGWFTSQAVADFCGVAARTVYNWLTGRYQPLEVRESQGTRHLLRVTELETRRNMQKAKEARIAQKQSKATH